MAGPEQMELGAYAVRKFTQLVHALRHGDLDHPSAMLEWNEFLIPLSKNGAATSPHLVEMLDNLQAALAVIPSRSPRESIASPEYEEPELSPRGGVNGLRKSRRASSHSAARSPMNASPHVPDGPSPHYSRSANASQSASEQGLAPSQHHLGGGMEADECQGFRLE